MASSLPLEVAETIQTAHINRSPSPTHDMNPSTAADNVQPASHLLDRQSSPPYHDEYSIDQDELDVDEDEDEDDYAAHLSPKPRRHSHLPPLPDLRFEQSYLHSIANADTWWKVAWITVCDQVMMPLAQGVLYNLAMCGWQYWNKNAQMQGMSAGARLRRWWYGVNNWALPPQKRRR